MTDKQEHIHIIATGGTIDAEFDPVAYKPTPRKESGIVGYIESYIKPNLRFTCSQVSAVDSLDMTDEIRALIKEEIDHSKTDKILITHGTDTMTETAEYLLAQYNSQLEKTVILTGAMFPLTFYPSDAAFNLGYAIAKLETLKPNIYVCMNTQIFTAGAVKKNKKEGLFESK